MKLKRLIRSFGSSWLVVSYAAHAHHSPAMFDGSKQLTLTGTVRIFQWTNPHSYIQLIVQPESGPAQEWSLEMGANVYLYNLGWRPSTVKAGDMLTVTVVPLRSGAPGGLLVAAQTADGKSLAGSAAGDRP
jgi:hypothetical protein